MFWDEGIPSGFLVFLYVLFFRQSRIVFVWILGFQSYPGIAKMVAGETLRRSLCSFMVFHGKQSFSADFLLFRCSGTSWLPHRRLFATSFSILHCVEKPPPILRLILPLTLAFAKLLCRTFSLPAGTCSTFVCPFGMTHFVNSSKAFCITSNCTDGECCTAAPLCTTFTSCLASGKVLVGDASSKYCAEVSCIESECCTLGKSK